jgi:ABC-type antimicrobial peptide transport system permease subunit
MNKPYKETSRRVTRDTIIVVIVGFVIGILLFNTYLSIVTAVGGGGMVWYALRMLGLNATLAMIAGIAMMAVGIYYQFKQLQKKYPKE